jgi:uncharacterized membrane protein YfcA
MNIIIIFLAFICEFVDSSLGMGYGTTLTPILLMMGFNAIEIIPCILISELCTGIFSAILHHKVGNVNLKFNSANFKVGLVIGLLSVVGCIGAVLVVISISKILLNSIIACIVISMGIVILVTYNRQIKFSWLKVGILGTIASFNKGLSGGGYGPLVMGGQVFSGIKTKNAIGITSFAESITCLTGIIIFLIAGRLTEFSILPYLLIGAMLSVPFSVFVVKKLPENKLKIGIGIFIIGLGVFTSLKLIFGW